MSCDAKTPESILIDEYQKRNELLKTDISQLDLEIREIDSIIKQRKRVLDELTKIKDKLYSEMTQKTSLVKAGQSVIEALVGYENIVSTNE